MRARLPLLHAEDHRYPNLYFLFLMGKSVNPRILREESVQVSGWANGLKRQTSSGGRPVELY